MMELRTQECGSARRRLFAVLLLLTLLVLVRPESAKAADEVTVDFTNATKITFADDGYGQYDYTSGGTTYQSTELKYGRTYCFDLTASSLVGFEGSCKYLKIYNESMELLYDASNDFYYSKNNLASMKAGRYYVTGMGYEDFDYSTGKKRYFYVSGHIRLIKQWDGEDSFTPIRLTENVAHTIYRNYYNNDKQILPQIIFSAEEGHIYRISAGNLNMDTVNYSSFVGCEIKNASGETQFDCWIINGSTSSDWEENLNLDNGYLDYKAGATGEMTICLDVTFDTDASFDISYKDVTCEVLGHSYGDYTVTKKATVTAKGEKSATCTVCGTVDTQTTDYKTGVAKASDGKKYYYKSGKISTKTTGVVKSDDKIYKIKKGAVVTSFTGTVKYKGKYYYLKKGVSLNNLTSMVEINGTWNYVEKGVITFKKTGVVKYKNQLWYVKESQLCTEKTGIVKYGSKYIYVKKGKFYKKFTGIASYGSDKMYVKNGYVDLDYLGEVKYKGKKYTIRGGYVV
jgi:hypothetical protein